jgi:hypothetical protein
MSRRCRAAGEILDPKNYVIGWSATRRDLEPQLAKALVALREGCVHRSGSVARAAVAAPVDVKRLHHRGRSSPAALATKGARRSWLRSRACVSLHPVRRR